MSSKDCGHKVPCGCGDKALTTPAACNTTEECAGEQCSELFDQECIVYTGPVMNAFIQGEDFIIAPGDRLDIILQKMLVAMKANDPDDIANAPYGLRFRNITSTGFNVTWVSPNGFDHIIYIALVSPVVNDSVAIPAGINTHTFTNLVSGGEYEIYIEEQNDGRVSPTFYLTLP